MAAYIDVNPVRAGMVKRAEDYRWCGYGQAVGCDLEAREGLGLAFDHSSAVSSDDFRENWGETSKAYRLLLHHEGLEIKPNPEKGQKGRKGYTQADLEADEKRGGTMSLGQVLRCRVRYFTNGAAIGSAAFIEEVFRTNRDNFGQRHPPDARSGLEQSRRLIGIAFSRPKSKKNYGLSDRVWDGVRAPHSLHESRRHGRERHPSARPRRYRKRQRSQVG